MARDDNKTSDDEPLAPDAVPDVRVAIKGEDASAMSRERVRIECLKIAVERRTQSDRVENLIINARVFEKYVMEPVEGEEA